MVELVGRFNMNKIDPRLLLAYDKLTRWRGNIAIAQLKHTFQLVDITNCNMLTTFRCTDYRVEDSVILMYLLGDLFKVYFYNPNTPSKLKDKIFLNWHRNGDILILVGLDLHEHQYNLKTGELT